MAVAHFICPFFDLPVFGLPDRRHGFGVSEKTWSVRIDRASDFPDFTMFGVDETRQFVIIGTNVSND